MNLTRAISLRSLSLRVIHASRSSGVWRASYSTLNRFAICKLPTWRRSLRAGGIFSMYDVNCEVHQDTRALLEARQHMLTRPLGMLLRQNRTFTEDWSHSFPVLRILHMGKAEKLQREQFWPATFAEETYVTAAQCLQHLMRNDQYTKSQRPLWLQTLMIRWWVRGCLRQLQSHTWQ